jgi:biotin carboxyl carrier protein
MKWQILIDGNVVDIDSEHLDAVTEVEPGVYSVVLGGDSSEVRLLPAAGGWIAEINGKRYPVEVRDLRNARRNLRNALGSGRQNVAAPMPGKVIRVLVKEGDSVEAGQGLVVVEAMKMQNEIKASRPAHVVSVLAKAGDTIGAGDTLVVLE